MFDHKRPDFELTPASSRRPKYHYVPRDPKAAPIVSIVTPFYNTGKVFEETARSVFAQSFQQWEWIIVDDGSTDQCALELLKKWSSDPRVKIIRQENRGLSAARNVGFSASISRYIFQLDSDDLLEPTAIEKSLWYLVRHSNVAFVNGFSVGFQAEQYIWCNGFHEGSLFLTNNRVCPVVLIDRDIHRRVGGYDEAMRSGLEDWDFWLKCAEHGFWGVTIPEITCWYRRREDHSEKWSEWSAEGIRKFVQRSKKKYPTIYKDGILPGVSKTFDDINRIDLRGTNVCSKNKKRALLIFPWFEMGGADQFNINLIKELKKQDWEFTIVSTLPNNHPWLAEFAKETPDIFILGHFLEIEDIPDFFEYLILSRNFDLVLNTNSLMGYFLLPFVRARFPKIPIADYTHVEEPHWLAGGYPKMSTIYAEHLDLQIAASKHVANWMIAEGSRADNILVRYINVSTQDFKPDALARKKWRSRLSLSDNIPIIVFAGRYAAQKRPLLLLEIARQLRAETDFFRLICVGSGDLSQQMEAFVAEHSLDQNVIFLGPQTNASVAEILAASDILLLPSAYEGVALIVYEAMATGLAVLASDVGGQSELVDAESGHLVHLLNEEQDAKNFASILKSWVANFEDVKRKGKAGRKIVEKNFDLSMLGPQMEAAFGDAIRKAQARPDVLNEANISRQREMAVRKAKHYFEYNWRLNWPQINDASARKGNLAWLKHSLWSGLSYKRVAASIRSLFSAH